MTMAKGGDGDTCAEIEIAAALGVEEFAALAAIEDKWGLAVVAQEMLLGDIQEGIGGAHAGDLRRRGQAFKRLLKGWARLPRDRRKRLVIVAPPL